MKNTLTTLALALLSFSAQAQPESFEMHGLPMSFVKKQIGDYIPIDAGIGRDQKSLVQEYKGGFIYYIFRDDILVVTSMTGVGDYEMDRIFRDLAARAKTEIKYDGDEPIFLMDSKYNSRVAVTRSISSADGDGITIFIKR